MNEPMGSDARTRRLGLYGAAQVVGRCRDFCRSTIEDWAWPGPEYRGALTDEERHAAVEDVLLLVSEAVTNAVRHGGGPTELVLRLCPSAPDAALGRAADLRIEVSDASRAMPRLRTPTVLGRPGGYGLKVMNLLARRWGVTPRAGGKTVWFEVAAPVPARAMLNGSPQAQRGAGPGGGGAGPSRGRGRSRSGSTRKCRSIRAAGIPGD
ncbi:ATP-binding protein [Streptomyces sp. NPDC051109]|uniref:ATP-binding protein n=1 Tax=Streptomyces sp. NPDC051109 TaxID=3365642 RepID=UPI0010F1B701